MNQMNRTLLMSLLSRCQPVLERTGIDINGHHINTTASPASTTMTSISSSRKTYDNAYFYILFVFLFYSFLAMALFKCFVGENEDKKDPYEEFINTGQSSRQKFNRDKFYFEDESSL